MATATIPPTTPPVRKANWLLTCLLFLAGWVFMYADRAILSPVQEEVREGFGLTNAQVGLLTSVFFIVYVLMQVPSGILGDRMGRVRLIFIGFVLFAMATSLTGFVGFTKIFGLLLLARAMAGFGEGLYYGPQYAKSGETTPTKFRALGVAIINSGQGIGTALGLIASGFITYTLGWGWEATFIIFGIPTFLTGLAMLLFIPDRKPERPRTTMGQEFTRFGSLLKDRSLLVTFLMLFCNVYAFFVMVTWLPTYLTQAWHVSKSSAGSVASLVFWVAIPAALLVGHLSDRWKRRKLFVVVLGPAGLASILLLMLAPSWPVVVISLVLYGVLGKLTLDPVLVAVIADLVPNELRSSAYGLYNGLGMAAAIISPFVTGALVDRTGGYRTAFVLSMALLALGTVVFAFGYREHSRANGAPITLVSRAE